MYLVTIGLLWAAGILTLEPLAYASCFVFLRNYIPEPYVWTDPFTAHAWSLSVEEHFYLIWPALLGLLATVARARRAAFLIALASIAWSFLDFNARISTRVLHLPINHHYWRTDYSLGGLLLGCWMALCLAEPVRRDRIARLLSPATWWTLLALFVWLATSVRENAARAIAAPVVPLLLAGTLLHPHAVAGRILEWWPLRWVGRISYSLYLWQQLFLIPPTATRPLGPLHDLPLAWIAAFALRLASYHVVERPAMWLGQRLAPTHVGSHARRSGSAPTTVHERDQRELIASTRNETAPTPRAWRRGRDYGRRWIRTNDFHRVRMALYRFFRRLSL